MERKYSILNLKTFISMLALATVAILSSCNEDEDPDPDESPIQLDAEIAWSPETPDVGDEITLDGSASSAERGADFDPQWSILSRPENSDATITDNNAIVTTFTPDVAGDYQIELEISNEAGEVSDTETVTITVLASGYVELSGSISSDMTLENIHEDPDAVDYLVTGNVSVSAVLTIEPGVLIHFQENLMMEIEQSGTLIAEGTETDTITFTTANRAGGILWKGILIHSATSENLLRYVKISHAGSSTMSFSGADFKAGLGVNSNGNVRVENSLFVNNDGYGVYLDDDGGRLGTFANNTLSGNMGGVGTWSQEVDAIDNTSTFINNTQADVEIFGSAVSQDTETTWNALSGQSSYTISGNIDVIGTLNIAPGAKFEVDDDVMINVEGVLIANGSTENLIEFTTSDETQSMRWKGIYFNSADNRNVLNHVNISYAGNSTMNFSGQDFQAGVGVDTNGKLSITNSTFSNNQGYAVYVDDGGGQLETFEANTFSMNDQGVGVPADEVDALDEASTFTDNENADVEIFSTTYTESKATTWPKLNGTANYRVSGNVNIDGDLTIAPGANFILDEDVMLSVNGSLSAEGTASEHITFTTSNLNGGLYWKGIYIGSGTNRNAFDYVELSYAGNSPMNFSGADFPAGIGVDAGARVSVTNSDLSNNQDYGLYIEEGSGQLESFSNNNFTMNAKGVGLPADEADAIDSNTTFADNSFAAVEIFGSSLSEPKAVTWNALSEDSFYRITGNLTINGVLDIAPGAAFEVDENVVIDVEGALIAEGEENNMITFTSSNTEGGLLWRGILIRSADARNTLDFTTVEFAGNAPLSFSGSDFAANVGVDTGARLEVTNSVISNSGGYGIYSKGTTNDLLDALANNTFTDNLNGNHLE